MYEVVMAVFSDNRLSAGFQQTLSLKRLDVHLCVFAQKHVTDGVCRIFFTHSSSGTENAPDINTVYVTFGFGWFLSVTLLLPQVHLLHLWIVEMR